MLKDKGLSEAEAGSDITTRPARNSPPIIRFMVEGVLSRDGTPGATPGDHCTHWTTAQVGEFKCGYD
jgi:hypothetical protein